MFVFGLFLFVFGVFVLGLSVDLFPDVKPDFQIISIRPDIPTGHIYVQVRNNTNTKFSGVLDFAIWYNGRKSANKEKLVVFDGNNIYDVLLCDFKYLNTSTGVGTIKIKVDYGGYVPETNDSNNTKSQRIAFVEVTNVTLKVYPIATLLKQGQRKTFTHTGEITVRGRGEIYVTYKWKRSDQPRRWGRTERVVFKLPQRGALGVSKTVSSSWTRAWESDFAGQSKNYWKQLATFLPNTKMSKQVKFGVKYVAPN